MEQSGDSDREVTTSQSEPKDDSEKAESTLTSEESKNTGDSGAKVEPSPTAPAPIVKAEASSKSGDEAGGGWGWGGWGRSLWSSVSTVTESAQALGQKVL